MQNQHQNDQQSYQNQQFQISTDNSYVSKVQKQFSINLQKLTYKKIEASTNQMRQMMKNVSKILDEKIHKYYGLMGVKVQYVQNDKQVIIQRLKREFQVNNKLINTQQTEIKDIEVLDEEMASSKRIQKQAQRLRQYFYTKKAMIQAQKQTRFSQGQVNKHGDYLARDFNIQRQYFRLNKIKQDLQYAMLRDKQLQKTSQQTETKAHKMQQRLQNTNKIYEYKIRQAQDNNILIQQNRSLYQQYHKKKQLLNKKQQIHKKYEISKYNLQSAIFKVYQQVQSLRKLDIQKAEKLNNLQNKINHVQAQINQVKQKYDLQGRIQLNMSIRNIDTLLKTKRQKNQSMVRVRSNLSQSLQMGIKPITLMTQSLMVLKPNFKIKPFVMSSRAKGNSKSDVANKSIQFERGVSNRGSSPPRQSTLALPHINGSPHSKRVPKYHHTKTKPPNLPPQPALNKKPNPQTYPNQTTSQ